MKYSSTFEKILPLVLLLEFDKSSGYINQPDLLLRHIMSQCTCYTSEQNLRSPLKEVPTCEHLSRTDVKLKLAFQVLTTWNTEVFLKYFPLTEVSNFFFFSKPQTSFCHTLSFHYKVSTYSYLSLPFIIISNLFSSLFSSLQSKPAYLLEHHVSLFFLYSLWKEK